MAYENGLPINKYSAKDYHKRCQKLRHIRLYGKAGQTDFKTFVKIYEDSHFFKRYCDLSPWSEHHKVYWRTYHSSSRRKVAKQLSKSISRAAVRKLKCLDLEDLEEVARMTRRQEKRGFEFDWYID